MSVWKRGGTRSRGGVCYITYVDRRYGQQVKRIVSSGVTDKELGKAVKKRVLELVDLRLAGEPTPRSLAEWAASTHDTLQEHLLRHRLIEPSLLAGRQGLAEMIEQYLADPKVRRQAASTLKTKRTQLMTLAAAAGNRRPRQLKAEHLQRVMDDVLEGGRSYRTAQSPSF